ncbi:hypothetical protein BHM03_00023777 [Ensete ventricosum]|nr:hypothetical protein BHM03_00023777 [Ensete ventricosum]
MCLVIRIVESVGEGVTDLAPGDHVLPVFTGECKECAHCLSEESNMCNLLRINTDRGVMLSDGQSRFSIKGKPINHFLGTSTFSEYTVVHSGCVIAEMTGGGADRSVECTGNIDAMISAFDVGYVYVAQEIELEKFITHEVTFSEINKAFDYMLQGASLRMPLEITCRSLLFGYSIDVLRTFVSYFGFTFRIAICLFVNSEVFSMFVLLKTSIEVRWYLVAVEIL